MWSADSSCQIKSVPPTAVEPTPLKRARSELLYGPACQKGFSCVVAHKCFKRSWAVVHWSSVFVVQAWRGSRALQIGCFTTFSTLVSIAADTFFSIFATEDLGVTSANSKQKVCEWLRHQEPWTGPQNYLDPVKIGLSCYLPWLQDLYKLLWTLAGDTCIDEFDWYWLHLSSIVLSCKCKNTAVGKLVFCRHWRDSRSRENLERKWPIFFYLELENWMFFSQDVLDCQDFEGNILVLLSKFEIFKKISLSLLDLMRFCKQILFSRVKIFLYVAEITFCF